MENIPEGAKISDVIRRRDLCLGFTALVALTSSKLTGWIPMMIVGQINLGLYI